jgi:hypothetical protein
MTRRIVSAVAVSLALAVVIHLDWHFARPAHHALSLGLPWHWLLAIPVFALVARYVARVWPAKLVKASGAIVGSAVVGGGVLEPAFEYFVGDATFDWAFGPARTGALAAYVGVGVLTLLVFLRVSRGQST